MSEHYFTASPAVEAEERTHRFTIRGVEHTVVTASGVFSADRLDKGTQVLLDHVPDPPQTGTFLDLGCGWGPIALALADAAPGATVLAADVNERSLALTARNADAAGLGNVRVRPAEELLAWLRETSTSVDLIWSNPPVRIGKEALHDLLLTWLALLSDDGEAWLVVLKNLGADSLAAWLTGQGWDVSRQASSKGFRVLRVRRSPNGPADG
ncbi:methyltransferase [Actinomyces viscosus]|uniref:class I SAM-dependent methyltransferase n=1 Tax=Actinomyces viscosus TaxID=1656 RepID=UPI0028F0C795|nr:MULTISPECIES: methyltransferase [Actinomyces]